MKNSTIGKDRPGEYLVFFLTGMVSYPLGAFVGGLLSEQIILLQNALCEFDQCGLDLVFTFGFLFPILVCSFLLAMGLYSLKERKKMFAFKVFALSFAAASLILFGGLIHLHFLLLPLLVLSLFLLFALVDFKKNVLFRFALRAFSISFIALFLIITGLYTWAASTEVMQGMDIEEVSTPLNKFEYVEISEAELEEYPAFKTAVEKYRSDLNSTEWERTRKFLDRKWLERNNLFVINEKDLEVELNKSVVTVNLRTIFASEGYPVPEHSYLKRDGDRWYIIKIYDLFSITDPEIEKELNRINITMGEDAGDTIPVTVRTAFASSGFSLPEDARISRENGTWRIPVGAGYTILKEGGTLNVYTGDEKTHEILREKGKLNVVYVGQQGSPIFKIRDKYYRFSFWVV